MSSFNTLFRLVSERKEEVKELLNAWEEERKEWKTYRDIESRLGWHPQKLTRWLKRLVDEGLLLRKKEGKHVYYCLNPGKLGPYIGILHLMWLEKLVKERLKGEAYSVLSYSQPSCSLLGGYPLRGTYLHFRPHPFWEYNLSLNIIGFPDEKRLLPVERIILNHVIKELLRYFNWLAWLRAKYLARRLLNIQPPMNQDLKLILVETLFREWLSTGKKEALHQIQRLFKIDSNKLIQACRKIKVLGEDITLPKPTPTEESLWSIMLMLREKGYAENLALIISSGPQRTSLTKRGLCFNTDDEDTPPMPPLRLPRGLSYKKLEGDLLVRISSSCQPPQLWVYNPFPFRVKPVLSTDLYTYRVKPVKDKNTFMKLERGDFASKLQLLDLEEILEDKLQQKI